MKKFRVTCDLEGTKWSKTESLTVTILKKELRHIIESPAVSDVKVRNLKVDDITPKPTKKVSTRKPPVRVTKPRGKPKKAKK